MAPKRKAILNDFVTNPVADAGPSAKAPPKVQGNVYKSLTLRLDRDRWVRLRDFLTHDAEGRSAQKYLTDLLDEGLDFTKPQK